MANPPRRFVRSVAGGMRRLKPIQNTGIGFSRSFGNAKRR